MYSSYSREKLVKLYPILETEATAILNFVSCDGVMGFKLAAVLGDLYPEMKYSFQNKCRNGEILKGSILINKKTKPYTIQIPFKESYRTIPDYDFLRPAFEKLQKAYKEKIINLESIAIQKNIVNEDLLAEVLEGLELPPIIFYEEVDIYKIIKEEKEFQDKKLKEDSEKEMKEPTKKI